MKTKLFLLLLALALLPCRIHAQDYKVVIFFNVSVESSTNVEGPYQEAAMTPDIGLVWPAYYAPPYGSALI